MQGGLQARQQHQDGVQAGVHLARRAPLPARPHGGGCHAAAQLREEVAVQAGEAREEVGACYGALGRLTLQEDPIVMNNTHRTLKIALTLRACHDWVLMVERLS